ncbi:MGDG synthase family glycosyltransferase [Salipaludibacillus daqingensis]|uniref:MGDG synthase family glycosyltransferase n=1 Tax=Salipaludibacillus daqingensis TaxID=3041001 RepID=UPI0024731B0B|nr:glycosyltransferase [Salipaludibacillus daqingensis]
MKDQPLIFSASIGNGHNQAAKALQEAFEHQGLSPKQIDTFHAIHPNLHTMMLQTYLSLLKITPFIWRKMYRYSENYPIFMLLDRFGALFVNQLNTFIDKDRCPFMISTHPFVTAFLCKLKQEKQLGFPLYTIITDFVLHPAYVRNEIDGYFTASHDIATFAKEHCVPPERFHATGIPILNDPSYKKSKEVISEQLGLDPTRKTLLIAGGGMGLTNYVNVLRAIEQIKEPIQIICMIGHNYHAEKKIIRHQTKHEVRAISFTDKFLSYLKASDAVISKAGGVTMAEALACEIPIILFRSVPGHEEHNAIYLTSNGAAVEVNDDDQLLEVVEQVLYEQSFYESLKSHARLLKKPNASYQIVEKILGNHTDTINTNVVN